MLKYYWRFICSRPLLILGGALNLPILPKGTNRASHDHAASFRIRKIRAGMCEPRASDAGARAPRHAAAHRRDLATPCRRRCCEGSDGQWSKRGSVGEAKLSDLTKTAAPLSNRPASETAGDVNQPVCMQCGGPMRFKLLETELHASPFDAMTYRCEACGTEVKRRVRRP